jgi:hypothetical protein
MPALTERHAFAIHVAGINQGGPMGMRSTKPDAGMPPWLCVTGRCILILSVRRPFSDAVASAMHDIEKAGDRVLLVERLEKLPSTGLSLPQATGHIRKAARGSSPGECRKRLTQRRRVGLVRMGCGHEKKPPWRETGAAEKARQKPARGLQGLSCQQVASG